MLWTSSEDIYLVISIFYMPKHYRESKGNITTCLVDRLAGPLHYVCGSFTKKKEQQKHM